MMNVTGWRYGRLRFSRLVFLAGALPGISCTDLGSPLDRVTPDAVLFRLLSVDDPFPGWQNFPRADAVTAGSLNGSQAHHPLVHVRLNAIAAGALVSDTLPSGEVFPYGSMIVKTILVDGRVMVLAVMRKEVENPLAGNGWLWAEYEPGGRPLVSVGSRGTGCTGCHARERGGMNDFVRTFERQH
jgi:hypothetical protein